SDIFRCRIRRHHRTDRGLPARRQRRHSAGAGAAVSKQFIGGVTMFRFTRIATVLASLMLCAALWAQTEPSTNVSLPPGPLKVTIKSVKGIVQFRTTADAKWEKAAEGTELREGAELRTGPRSMVQFSIGDDQVVTLDRLGTIQIL